MSDRLLLDFDAFLWSREEIACSAPNAAAEALAVSSCEVQTAFSS